MAHKSSPTQGDLYGQILKEGKLCISKTDKLYIGIQTVTSNEPCCVVEYNNPKGKIVESSVSFTRPLKMPDNESIFVNILKPFSKDLPAMHTSVDFFHCIRDFISIERLFMFVLKHKFAKDYTLFMNLCQQNLSKIRWDTKDDEGNTMIHYVTIMSQYPEVACDIIRYINSNKEYKDLINKTNSNGMVPLASSLYDKFICDSVKKVHSGILDELIHAGANLLLKTPDTNKYVWKGGSDSIFCVLNGVPDSILVATKSFVTKDDKNCRICCRLKKPPECELISLNNLNANLPQILLERVLEFPCIQIVKTLFTKKHCNFDTEMPDGTMVLHHIIQHGREELVHYLFEQKPDLLLLDKNNNSILHLAILKNEKNASIIIEKFPTPDLERILGSQNKNNQTPLDMIFESKLPNSPNLISLINKRVPKFLSRIDGNGNSLLHRAVGGKCTDLLKYLAEQEEIEEIVNAKNSNGDSAIMLCVQSRFVDGFPIVINLQQCNGGETDDRGYTLLHLAIIYFEEEIFSQLLKDLVYNNILCDIINQAIIPTQSTSFSDKLALTPLLLCMFYKHFTAARLLIQQGATIDTPDYDGYSFNFYLFKHCHDPVELEEFFNVKLNKSNFQYKSPPDIYDIKSDIRLLSLCVRCNNKTAFSLLLSNCSIKMIAYQDKSLNILHLILSDKKYSHFLNPLLDRLAQLNTDKTQSAEVYQVVNQINCEGQTPLIIATHASDSVIVNKLLNLGCDVYKNIELLHIAAKYGDTQIITFIQNRIQNPESLNKMLSYHNKEDQTPLHIAIHRKELNMIKKFLLLDIDMTKQDKKDTSLLNYAIEQGEEIFQVIFEKLKTCNAKLLETSIGNCLPEHCIIHSITHRNLLALRTLTIYNKNLINITYGHLPILHYAISKQFDGGVKLLISHSLSLAVKKAEHSFTLHKQTLNLSLVFTESKVGYRLSNGYVMTDIPGFTTTEYYGLPLPSVNNKNTLLKNLVLCESIEPIESYLCTNKSSLSQIETAQLSLISSQFATQEIMLYLLNDKCPNFSFNWSSMYTSGNTVVHVGVFNTCINTFLSILKGLHAYQESKTWNIVNIHIPLLSSEKQIDIRNDKSNNALELAIFENNSEAFDALIKHGASLITKDKDQNNILHNFITCKNADISYLDRILVEIAKMSKDLINEYNNAGYTPLHLAVSTCSIQVYRKIIALESCRYDAVTESENNNIVHLAMKNGNPELLKQILKDLKNRENTKDEKSKLINQSNAKSLIPAFLAVECGNIELILENPEFSGVDAAGVSLLHSAVKHSNKSNKHLDMIELILSKRENMLNTKDNSNETPLHYAIKLKMEKALALLLACNSIDLSCQNLAGMTALHFAIQSNTNILKTVLNEIDRLSQSAQIINTQDKKFKTALHHCIEQTTNSEDKLKLLLSRNPDLSLVDEHSNNVLHYAAMNKSGIKYLKTLIIHIDKNCPHLLQELLSKQNQQINTPLYCAIQNSNVNGVDELLKIKASLPVVDKEGIVTLCNRKPFPHIDVPMRIYEVRITQKPELSICVGFKLSEQQWILSDLPNLSVTYLTHKSPSYSSQQVSEIRIITEDVLTSNLLACQCYEPLELFINEVKNQRYKKLAKLMHLAAANGSVQIVKYLMEYYGADVPFLDTDQEGYSIIHYSIENKHSEILGLLCARMKNDYPEKFNELSGKLLHFCITKGFYIKSFTILLERQYESNVSYTDEHGDTLLHLIVLEQQQNSYTKVLLKCSQLSPQYEYCNLLNNNRNTALHIAIMKNQLNNVTEILKCGPDISIQDSVKNMALHLAVEHSNYEIITEIIKFLDRLPEKLQLINSPNATDSNSMPIHLATLRGLWKIVELLLSHGAELYSVDASSNTILHLAVQLDGSDRLNMMTNILEYEKNSGNRQFIFTQDKEGRTPLHLAIENGHVDCVRELLKHPIDFKIVDNTGETVLHYAIRECTDELFDLIFNSILPLATQPCHASNQRLFSSQNSNGVTPLHLCIELQYEYAVEKLISQSTCVDIRDTRGMTILHYAAYFQKEKLTVIEQIILFTKNISTPCLADSTSTEYILNSLDNLGRTPLLLAIESTNLFAVNAILACSPAIFIKDHKGNGVISYAAMNPLSLEILRNLLSTIKRDIFDEEYVTLINELNCSGLSALHVSIYSKNLKGAELLVANGAKLVLTQTRCSIQTVGKHCMSVNNVSLKIGTLSRPEKEVNIVCYEFPSVKKIIYSTLPSLCDVDFTECKDFEGNLYHTPLIQDILQSNCTEIIEAIHENHPNFMNEEFEQIPFLHLAAQDATLPIMQYICQKFKFIFERRDNTECQETAIHYSVNNPCPEVVDCLLDKVEQYERKNSLSINIIDITDSSDCSPLKKSTKKKQWKNFMILIKHGADFTKKDSNGTILHAMVSENDSQSSESLDCLIKAINQSNLSSEKKQSMFNTTHSGLTAVHLAVSLCNSTAAIQLINAEVDLSNTNNSNGFTIVHTCVNNPQSPANLHLLNVLCKAVAYQDLPMLRKYKILHNKDQRGNTSLHYTIKMEKSVKVLEILLNNGAPFSVGDTHGNTPLHLGAKHNLLLHVRTILYSIQNDARERGYGPSSRKERCIAEIMRKNNKKELPILLTKNKDILLCMLKYWDNDTLLDLNLYRRGNLIHFAVFNQEIELIEAILESQSSTKRFEMLRSRDSDNYSPLHIAAEKNNSVIGKLLIDHGVDVNIRSVRGTPIEVAIKCEAVQFATKLINEGADIKRYVFLLANDLISEKNISRILDNKHLSIDDRYSTGYCSVIHYAARQSSTKRIAFLLRKNADLLSKDRDGRGAIHHVISSRRDPTILRFILDEAHRLDLNNLDSPNLDSLLDCDYSELTPGMHAAQLDYLEFFEVICTKKYKFHLETFHYTDPQGDNLLHHLIKCNSMQCIRFLLPYLATNLLEEFSHIVNGRNVLGLSPMGLARGKGQYETVHLLIKLCDAKFFEACPDVVHRIADEEDNKTLSSILDKMVECGAKQACISTKIMDANEEGGYPNFAIFNYHLAPLWHKMYSSQNNRIKYHPLLKFTVDAKIKLYQWWYLLMLFLYLLFYIPMVSALLIASIHSDDMLFYYYSHLDNLRLMLEIYIILITMLYMANEAIEVFGKWKYLQNLPTSSRNLAFRPPDQIRYYGLGNLEGMVFNSVLKVFIEIPHIIKYKIHVFDRKNTDYLLRAVFTHISTSYSILELTSVFLLLSMFYCRLLIFFTISPSVSALHWTISALTFIAFTFKFFKYTKIFPTLGIYIETIFQVLKKDVPRFMIIILLILVGYAGGAHLVARRFGSTSEDCNSPSNECSPSSWLGNDFDSVYSIITPLLSGVLFLVGGGPADFELELYQIHIIFSLFYLTFAFGIIVVLLNIFIAQLSQTYSDIHSEKHILDYKADLALHYEKQSNLAFIFEWFFSKALRRIMVEKVTIPISEWRSYVKFYSDRINRDDEILFQDLGKSTHKSEPKGPSNENSEIIKLRESMDAKFIQQLITQIQLVQQPGEQEIQSPRNKDDDVKDSAASRVKSN